MENTLRNALRVDALTALRLIEGVRVESLVGNNVVLEQCLQIFLTVLAEEEAIDSWTKLLESEVVRCKQCATKMI